MRILLVLIAALSAASVPAVACSGPDPSIASVSAGGVTTNDGLSTYRFVGRVTNVGGTAQASNVLQFVDVYQSGQKVNSIGIPPLKPGRSYTFSYAAQRSADAGAHTTTLSFRLRMRQPTGDAQDCNVGNDHFSLRF